MPQTDPCHQLQVTECLVEQTAAFAVRDRRELKEASWVHGICMQVLTFWDFFSLCLYLCISARPSVQEYGVLKFPDLREEESIYYAVSVSGAEFAVLQYVEVCELLAGGQETYYAYERVGIFCDKRN